MEITKDLKDSYEKALSALKRDNYDYAIDILSGIVSIQQDFATARHFLRIAERKKYETSPPNSVTKIVIFLISIFYTIKAFILRLRNDPSLAVMEYEKILALNPFAKNTLFRLGKTFIYMGLNESAIYAFEEIFAMRPKNIVVLKNLGKLYMDIGEYDKSKSYYKKLMEIHPHDHDAEKGLRNIDALGTIKRNYASTEEPPDFKIKI